MVAIVALLSLFMFIGIGAIMVHYFGYVVFGIVAMQMGQAGNFKIALIFGAICFLDVMRRFFSALREVKDSDEENNTKA